MAPSALPIGPLYNLLPRDHYLGPKTSRRDTVLKKKELESLQANQRHEGPLLSQEKLEAGLCIGRGIKSAKVTAQGCHQGQKEPCLPTVINHRLRSHPGFLSFLHSCRQFPAKADAVFRIQPGGWGENSVDRMLVAQA